MNLSQEILYFDQYPDKPFLMKMVLPILIIFTMLIILMKIIIMIIIQIIIIMIITTIIIIIIKMTIITNNYKDNDIIILYRFCFKVINIILVQIIHLRKLYKHILKMKT